jgi:hypothetical protein
VAPEPVVFLLLLALPYWIAGSAPGRWVGLGCFGTGLAFIALVALSLRAMWSEVTNGFEGVGVVYGFLLLGSFGLGYADRKRRERRSEPTGGDGQRQPQPPGDDPAPPH